MNVTIDRQIAGITIYLDTDLSGNPRIFASSLEGFCFSMTPDEADRIASDLQQAAARARVPA